MPEPAHGVFLSYASQDAEAAQKIAEALRAAGIEVWFDQSELRGGDAWDRQIRKQIHDCRLFIAVISAQSESRDEGYFRREWKLAVERTGDLAADVPFLLPVVIDRTSEATARVPDEFLRVQWTRLPSVGNTAAFVERVSRLLSAGARDRPIGARTPDQPQRKRSQRIAPVIVAAAAGIVYLAVHDHWASQRAPVSKRSESVSTIGVATKREQVPEESVAVLPFVDMSDKHDQEYFADGMSEELIDHLGRLSDLRVIARTSSFQFKGRNEDVRAIAAKLSVAHLLEGSVRKSGDVLRVTAQLVKAADGSRVWSQTYQRKFTEVFKIQDEIAESVCNSLNSVLHEGTQGSSLPGPDAQAYNLVLEGNYFKSRFNRTDLEHAVKVYREAISIDPNYALAWARLGAAYRTEGVLSDEVALKREYRSKAGSALNRAIELDPNLTWGLYSIAGMAMSEWEWPKALALVDRIRAIDPNSLELLSADGDVARVFGRPELAITKYRALLTRDPLNPDSWSRLASAQQAAGQLQESIESSRRVLELSPAYAGEHADMAITLLRAGRIDNAMSAANDEPDSSSKLTALTVLQWAAGDKRASNDTLHDLTQKHSADAPVSIAGAYSFRGETTTAFSWLERAYKQHDADLAEVRFDPLLTNLRDDLRYKALLRDLKLDRYPQPTTAAKNP